MAASTGIVLAVGGITAANELILAPLATSKPVTFNWRLIPAVGGLALALAALEKLAPSFATGLALLCLATVLVVPFSGAPTPLENAIKILGY